MGKIKLNLDWDALFPGKEIDLYGEKIFIKPMESQQIGRVISNVKSLIQVFDEQDITFENYKNPDKLLALLDIIMQNSPEIISEATGISLEDINRLPIDANLLLLVTAVEVNLESKESLEKNLSCLTKKLQELGEEQPVETPKQTVEKMPQD